MRPHRWQPTRLHRPWDSPGKNTGVGCHSPQQMFTLVIWSLHGCFGWETEAIWPQSWAFPSSAQWSEERAFQFFTRVAEIFRGQRAPGVNGILCLVAWGRRKSNKALSHAGCLYPYNKVTEEAREGAGLGKETQSLLWSAKGLGSRKSCWASLEGCSLSLSSVTNPDTS